MTSLAARQRKLEGKLSRRDAGQAEAVRDSSVDHSLPKQQQFPTEIPNPDSF